MTRGHMMWLIIVTALLSVAFIVNSYIMALSAPKEASAHDARLNPLHNVQLDTSRNLEQGETLESMTYLSSAFTTQSVEAGQCMYAHDVTPESFDVPATADQIREIAAQVGYDGDELISHLKLFSEFSSFNGLCQFHGQLYLTSVQDVEELVVYEVLLQDGAMFAEPYQPMPGVVGNLFSLEYVAELESVIVKMTYGHAGDVWWGYHWLDRTTMATDLLESCMAYNIDSEVEGDESLECKREYVVTTQK